MAIRKCPRCELNYILDGAPYCPICTREMKGAAPRDDTLETCSICNDNPVLPGNDMCPFCLKEMEGAEQAHKAADSKENPLDDVTEMEDISIDDDDDIPDGELGEIDRELSLDDVLAEQEREEDEDDEEANL